MGSIDDVKDSVGGAPLHGVTVCYVSTEAFSAVTRTMKQARTLRDAGADVYFAGYDELVPASIRDSGFRVVSVPFRSARPMVAGAPIVSRLYNATIKRALNLWRRLAAPRELADAIARAGADVVQSVDLPALACAARAAKALDATLIYDSHELWSGFLENPELGASDFDKRRLLGAERAYAPRAALVLTTSDEMSRRLTAAYPLRQTLTVFNSPPGTIEFKEDVSCPVRLVFHGSLARTKNVREVVLAMKRVRGLATLDVHGGASEGEMRALEALVADNDLAGTVRLHGPFDYERVLALISGYDVGVYAAQRIEENFAASLPNKLFDCICGGLAVAMSDLPAIAEIVNLTGCGICLDPSSADTIGSGLKELVSDPMRIAEMKANSRRFAREYGWEAQGTKLVDELCALLECRTSEAGRDS